MRLILSGVFATFLAGVAQAQSFSCPIGKEAACLDYGDKVCSSLGKCVTQDAICFDSYTCDFNGFVCKSALDDVIDEYDALPQKARSLASDYDDLRSRYDEAVDELDALKDRYDHAVHALQVSSDCVQSAVDLDEAQRCY